MDEIDIAEIREMISAGLIIWTEHLALRLKERGIKRADVIECLENGEIIEQYPDDMPFQSCLILGMAASGNPIHVVCALDHCTSCCIITAYSPSLDKWEPDNKTRKAVD